MSLKRKIWMRAVVLENPGKLALAEHAPPPSPGAGEARVRIHRIGICGTDMHAFRGRQPFFTYPRVLGHELGVEVIEVGPGVMNVKRGDRCAVEPYLHCGRCIACRRGRPNCCVELKVLGVHVDGGMRERMLVPAAKLHPSAKLSLEQLALVETLGIGAHAVSRGTPEPGETVLVIGAGPIGLSVVQFAKLAQARIIVMDLNHDRLDFARRQFGVSELIRPEDDPAAKLQSLTNGDMPALVFDATGSPQSMHQSFNYVAHGGRLVFVSLVQADIVFHDPDFHRRELTLLATRNSTPNEFRRIIRLMEEGAIDTTPWITHRAPFAEAVEQFPLWLDPQQKVIKAMLEL